MPRVPLINPLFILLRGVLLMALSLSWLRGEVLVEAGSEIHLRSSGAYQETDDVSYVLARGKSFFLLTCELDLTDLPVSDYDANGISFLFDTPQTQAFRISRRSSGFWVRMENPETGVSYYNMKDLSLPGAEVVQFRIEIDLLAESWRILIDDTLVHTGPFYAAGDDINQMQVSLGNSINLYDQGYTEARLSNFKLDGLIHPSGGASIWPLETSQIWVGERVELKTREPLLGEPLRYQWFFEGEPIAGATNETLEIERMEVATDGIYELEVSNLAGSIRFLARLWVLERMRPRNLSSRMGVGGAGNATVIGFVTRHVGERDYVLRGVGPTLAEYGVRAPAANPKIQLFKGSEEIASNRDWSDTDASLVGTEFEQVGAFPLLADEGDAALRVTLTEGVYSMVVENEESAVGTALGEIYELENDGGLEGSLLNISTRAEIRQPGDTLVMGLVVRGNAPKKFLIRAVGPGLAEYGIERPLLDPKLVIERQTDQLRIEIDDWADFGESIAAAEQVGAFALESGGKDASHVMWLFDGLYTVTISGVDPNDTGTVLGEIYMIPEDL